MAAVQVPDSIARVRRALQRIGNLSARRDIITCGRNLVANKAPADSNRGDMNLRLDNARVAHIKVAQVPRGDAGAGIVTFGRARGDRPGAHQIEPVG